MPSHSCSARSGSSVGSTDTPQSRSSTPPRAMDPEQLGSQVLAVAGPRRRSSAARAAPRAARAPPRSSSCRRPPCRLTTTRLRSEESRRCSPVRNVRQWPSGTGSGVGRCRPRHSRDRSQAGDGLPAGPAATPRIRMVSAPARSRPTEQIVYDEHGLVPCVVQDWSRARSDARVHERAGAPSAPAHGRAAPLQPLALGAVAQGSHQRQHPRGEGAAPGLRRRHAARPRGAGRAGLPHGRAQLLPSRRARAARAV